MTGPELFDPLAGPRAGWPAGTEPERACLEAFAGQGSRSLIANLTTQVLGLCSGERVFPVTVNTAQYGDAYVCLPHTAYSLYAKAELRIVDAGPWSPALRVLADVAGGAMRAARINRIVHLNNWMLSTNLHGGWPGNDLISIRNLLQHRFPDHVLAVRSLNRWSDADLVERFVADGWVLVPSRQIHVTDDLRRDWLHRRDTMNDLKLVADRGYRIDDLEVLRPGDAERIAHLYAMLYLERYSALNPAFTPRYIAMTHAARLFRYRAVRDRTGAVAAVVGCFVRGDVLTTPIVGYDTSRPRGDGLYRAACVMLSQMAMREGLRLNGSAGAAEFKRHRGARPVIEYSAMCVAHLSASRRAVVHGLAAVADRLAAPLVARRGL